MSDTPGAGKGFDPLRNEVLNTGVFLRPGTMLLIDADARFAEECRAALEKENHTLLLAADGRTGLRTAEEEKPDIIIVDIDVNGYDLCRRFKAHAELRYSPVVLVTTHTAQEVHLKAMDAGANDFQIKPCDWPVFSARISSLLKYRRAIAALRNARTELEQRVKDRTAELLAANQKLKTEMAERERMEHALRESEERYALACRGSNDGLWDWNLDTNRIYYSPRWKAMVGQDEASVSDDPDEWFRRVHPEDIDALNSNIRSTLDGVTTYLQHEFRMLYSDNTYRWMLCRGMPVRGGDNRAFRMVGSNSDITVRKMAELQLLHNAFHDELTGLPNRALFMDRVNHALERMHNGQRNLAVFFLDLDRFKIVNDSLGHKVGNQLLIEFGRRLRRGLRPSDTVARLGGDEFAVLLEDLEGPHEANEIANSIREGLKKPFRLGGRDVFVTTSVGILIGKKNYGRAEDLLRDAETAMHRAKELGKSRHETFNSGMHAQVVSLLHLENDLRHAVEEKQFVLHYQPIISLENGKLEGFEALVRWNHPERGMIPPSEFIPLAEETELITPMTLWIMREACTTLKRWREKYPEANRISVSINLSGSTCAEAGIIDQFARILEETGVPPSALKMEITEGTIMAKAQSTTAMLSQMKTMQMQLSIDDFGTGYSSLSYLHRLPIDILKIDRSFVSNMGIDNKNSEIVRTIMSLAANLGMKVVAEGVETQVQLGLLKELRCQYGQGYFFAKPAPAEKAEELIASGRQW